VNALLLLMGLLLLSYIGSFLVGGRAIRGMGLPSGVEYVALGFLLGPQVLGIVEHDMLDAFEPVAHVALGWLALVIGVDYGVVGTRRVRFTSVALGAFGALVTGGAVGAAIWVLDTRMHVVSTLHDRWLLAGGIGMTCAETTRHAVRWVVERYDAKGPLSELLADISDADDLLPLVGLGVLFALEPSKQVPVHIPLRDWPLITVGLGLMLGAMSSLLIGRELRLHHTWGVLFGMSLLAIGTAARLDLPTLTVTFFMGLGMSAVSKHRKELRAMVAPTERPVLLPALLLAGAHVDIHANPKLPWIIGTAILARVVAKAFLGASLQAFTSTARKGGPRVGFALLSSGALSMSIGLAFALRFPGAIGDTVLACAAASATFGEFVAPVTLHGVLKRAGEIVEPATEGDAANTEKNAEKAVAS
jgi:hypothetical protein